MTPQPTPSADQTPSYPSAKEVADVIISELKETPPAPNHARSRENIEEALRMMASMGMEEITISKGVLEKVLGIIVSAETLPARAAEHAALLKELGEVKAELAQSREARKLHREACEKAEAELAAVKQRANEMEARAVSLALHLPPETLAGNVQRWRDEAQSDLTAKDAEIRELKDALGDSPTRLQLQLAERDLTAKDATIARLELNFDSLNTKYVKLLADSAAKAKALGEMEKQTMKLYGQLSRAAGYLSSAIFIEDQDSWTRGALNHAKASEEAITEYETFLVRDGGRSAPPSLPEQKGSK